jgi:hypothetical protein
MKELSVFDPTVQPKVEAISYSKRPKSLNGLRIGLVENTKSNSDKLLIMIADILKKDQGFQAIGFSANAMRVSRHTRKFSTS